MEGETDNLKAIMAKQYRPPQVSPPSDRVLLDMALTVLHNMATENVGWRSIFRRWYCSDEPLRNDAANIVRHAGFQRMRPENTRLVGDP